MSLSRLLYMASSSATAAAYVPPQDKYDVFLSFRGPDTREGFTNYLYEALERKQIKTFIDDRIEKGDGITKALEEAIEQSRISIIVFSEKYATSRWCLDELVHILDCEEKYGRVVKHVFYKISPSEVRNPAEGCYAKAFESYEKEERFKDRVPIWKDALSTAANKSGFNSAKHEIEAKLIEEIVNDVLVRLNCNSPIIVPGLVGVKSQIEQIESLLCIEAQHVKFRLVGIWGMGGIGKTTLADAVYHRLSSKFEGCAFISNVRERSEKQGIHHVRNELFHKLIMDESISIDSPSIGSRSVLDRLSRTKALVVLDDVNESEQLEYLLGQQVVFGRGSRVIITSRDRRPLVERVDDDHIYKVAALNDDDALELFHSKASNDGAFKISNPDLLKEVASYAKGVPLLLKVLGSSFLHCNSGKDCEDRLKILKMCPDKKSQDLLRVGYSGLGEYVKGIFLDIACFFKGEKRHDAERLIELHGFYAPAQGISVLVDMSLISISMDDRLEMHDLLQEMGMAIVREQCVSDPGRRTRLWSAEDVYRVSKYNTGTPIVEGMLFDISEIQGRQLSRTTFTNMHNLRLLKCYVSNYSVNALDLPQGLETLPESLRYVYWYRYCLDSLPLEFLPCNLVELRMPFSRIKKLWSNGKNLGSLKVIDLSSSYGLCEVPDLSQSPNIEEINLSWCSNLVEIPPYFKNLHKLASLKLNYCGKLETFPDEMPCNLRFLDLSRCTHLTKVPDISRCANIEEIDLSGTRLVEIPLYFQHLDKLRSLNLGDCLIEYIPQLPCNLEKLFLYNCTCLKKLAKGNYRLNRLETLDLLSCWALEKLPPFSVGLRSLRELILSDCKSLEIPAGLICLSSLHTVHLEKSLIESIPGNIKYASGLRILNIANCMKLRSLPELPPLIEKLDASGCTSLQRVASSRTTVQQYEDPYCRKELLNFVDCLYLNGSSRSNIMYDAQCRIMQMASSKVHKTRRPNGYAGEDSFTVCYPGNYIPEWFCSYRGKGCSVEFEFSPDWSTDFLGFALCAVVAGENSYGDDARFIYKTNNGECYRDQNFGTDGICSKTRKDYVVWYFTKLEHSTYGGRRPIPFNEVTNASFHFYSGGKLKACGIRLLYAHNAVGSSCRPYKVVTTGELLSGFADPTDDVPLLEEVITNNSLLFYGSQVYSEMATAASNGSGTGTGTVTVTVTAKRKPVFIKVEEIQPGTSGHTLTVKVVRSNPVTSKYGGAPSSRPLQPPRIAECLVGDETGTIVFTARKDQVDIMKPGTTVILRNAKIDMFKGTMRLAVDKWGRVEVTEPASFEVMETNNLSLVEYELVQCC